MKLPQTLRTFPRWMLALILLGLLGNVLGWLLIGPLPDEAYYWVWSQHLQAGYYDHPPLIAWMNWAVTALFGDHAWAFRLPAVLSWFVGAWFSWRMAREVYASERVGAVAVLIWSSLPIAQAGFHIETPDTPLAIFTCGAYYFAWRAMVEQSGRKWLLAGAMVGLALLGKYPGILVPVAIFVALFFSTEGRRALTGRWPWLAALVGMLVFSPVVWWNWRNDWISFAFQLHHGVHQSVADPWHMLMIFIAGQLPVVMPWTLLAMLYASLRRPRPAMVPPAYTRHLLVAGFWLPLLLFGFASLTSKGEANWPLIAYIPGVILLAGTLQGWLDRPEGGARRGVVAAVVVAYLAGLLLVNLVRFPYGLEAMGIKLPPQRTQLSQTYGWQKMAPLLKQTLAAQSAHNPYGDRCRVIGGNLQTASMLALLLDQPQRVTISDRTRFNQFHLWARAEPVPRAALCLFVEKYDEAKDIRTQVDLGPAQGQWQRIRLLKSDNPDGTSRWFAFFVPARDAAAPTH